MKNVFLLLLAMAANPAEAQDSNRNFDVIPADGWAHHDKALSWVNDLTPNQTIELTVVEDPADANVTYFATSAAAEDGQGGSLLSIYRYNTQSQFFERLWRKEIASGEAALEWQVIGVDNGRVVFIEQTADSPTETCIQPVISGNDKANGSSLWSLPGDNLVVESMTWKEQPAAYTPPQEVLDEARTKQTDCEGGQQPAPEEQPQ